MAETIAPGVEELLRKMRQHVAEKHDVLLAKDDSLLIAFTGNLFILQETAARSAEVHGALLKQHRAELELLLHQWTDRARHITNEVLTETAHTAKRHVQESTEQITRATAAQLAATVNRHERIVERATLVLSLASVALLAAAGVLLVMSM